jgi:hypothetical protein
MKKAYGVLLAVIVLVAIGLAGSWAKTMDPVPASPGNIRLTSFAVVRPALRPGERTSIGVSIGDDAHGAVTYVWKVDAGTLSAADTNPVIWTAPHSEGHYQVRVEVTNAAGSKSGGSAGILVSRRPAAQLVMSVDPMGGKQRSTDVAGASAQTSSGD